MCDEQFYYKREYFGSDSSQLLFPFATPDAEWMKVVDFHKEMG